jgi:DNA processing protein
MAAPGFPADPRSASANRLIRDGTLLIRSADDVLAGLPTGLIGSRPPRPKKDSSTFRKPDEIPVSPVSLYDDDPHQYVKNALAAAPITVDELTRECQLSPSTVAAILQGLELGGELERLPGQRVAFR